MRAAWPICRLETCIKHVKRTTVVDDAKRYRRVTVRLRGQGISLRDEVLGAGIKTKKQYIVNDSDLLVAEIDAKSGAYGVVPSDLSGAIVSSHYFTYEIDRSRVLPTYLDYWLKTPSAQDQVLGFIRGSLNYAAIRPYQFPQLEFPLPPLTEQKRIVELMGALWARTDEAKRLRELIEDEREELLQAVAREIAKDAPRRPMQQVAPLTRRPVRIDKAAMYPELGIRSFGRGTFHKPAISGENLGRKRLFHIHPGDLVFSNVFSWEGAIAVAQDADAGRVGSHRFITCLPNPTLATAEFLRCWYLSDEGMTYILEASPGAAGRNRTLGLKKLMAIPVPVPPINAQRTLTMLSDRLAIARQAQSAVANELDAMIPAVLDQAFCGDL